ncbi:predicted protein [Postia placenta Mad-698-R]|uniref:F-box domain-containing protein n=1 Tax=Postia placenta MAD-698-R-SB12 TaxID=670580 RepID=A0A1X6N0C6_9APHY|nr:hypothetical protein POSPLADRAFT_1033706 [Postia placenta MAD-698-R-SB12]EED82689.1 predicted protein [Postia placenta Mad-698-R]OSX61936.1 hypothetical protein POSPLADRAFT_1033706 [Postia placenta MAD-698-R-SB12]
MQNGISSQLTQASAYGATFLDLYDDVLAMIAPDLTTKESLQLVAKRQELSSVTIESVQAVIRICKYMLEDVVGRLQWIPRLSVSVWIPDKGSGRYEWLVKRNGQSEAPMAMGLLVSLLEQAHGLQYLHVGDVDNNLEFDHALLDAICALPNLVELELLRGDQFETMKLLDGLQNRLRILRLGVQVFNADKDAMISGIGRFQELRVLGLGGMYTQRSRFYKNTTRFMHDLHHTWPDVNHLTIAHCDLELPAVLHAFPNLRALTFTEWDIISRSMLHDRSAYSVKLQGPNCLEYVEGSGHLFEDWPAERPVYHILIQSVLAIPSQTAMGGETRCGDPEIPILLEMARNAEPVILTFRIMAFESLHESFWKRLAAEATRLRCLEVGLFEFRETKGLTSLFQGWMTNVPSSLSPITSLLYLEIAIDVSTSWFISCVRNETPEPINLDYSEAYAERLASLVIMQIPSLRYLSLGFGSMASHLPTPHIQPFAGRMWMWKAEGTGGERALCPVPSTIARRLKVLLKSPDYDPLQESDDASTGFW